MTGPIVAIGGGEIATEETRSIDEYIRSAAPGNEVVFIPTASGDSEEYCEKFESYYGDTLGMKPTILRLTESTPPSEARTTIDAADVVYVGGGDTSYFVDTIRSMGILDAFRKHRSDGGVLTGLSAGALCWFRDGLSDAVALPDVEYGPVTGFGFIDRYSATVHADFRRREQFLEYLRRRNQTGVAIGDCAAFEVTGEGQYRVHQSSPNGFVYFIDPTAPEPVHPLPSNETINTLSSGQ